MPGNKRILAILISCLLVTCAYIIVSRKPVTTDSKLVHPRNWNLAQNRTTSFTRILSSAERDVSESTNLRDWAQNITISGTRSMSSAERRVSESTTPRHWAKNRTTSGTRILSSVERRVSELTTPLRQSTLAHDYMSPETTESNSVLLGRSAKWQSGKDTHKLDDLFEKILSDKAPAEHNTPFKSNCHNCVVFKHSDTKSVVSDMDADMDMEELQPEYDCRKIDTYPNPTICLYPSDQDIYVSRDIRRTGKWEEHIVSHVVDLLNLDQSLGFIDLGANIGVYTLAAAKLGHRTLAVEPYTENARRLFAASERDKTSSQITLLHNAVSDEPGASMLVMNKLNQGDIRLSHGTPNATPWSSTQRYGYTFTQVITLNNLVPFLNHLNVTSAIMKIDIQGHEHRIFRAATGFLDAVYVPYIFMEWVLVREMYGSEVTRSADKTLATEMVGYLVERGYTAHSAVTREELPVHMWYAWPEDVYWQHELAAMIMKGA